MVIYFLISLLWKPALVILLIAMVWMLIKSSSEKYEANAPQREAAAKKQAEEELERMHQKEREHQIKIARRKIKREQKPVFRMIDEKAALEKQTISVNNMERCICFQKLLQITAKTDMGEVNDFIRGQKKNRERIREINRQIYGLALEYQTVGDMEMYEKYKYISGLQGLKDEPAKTKASKRMMEVR